MKDSQTLIVFIMLIYLGDCLGLISCHASVEYDFCKNHIADSSVSYDGEKLLINCEFTGQSFVIEMEENETVRICSDMVEFGYVRIWTNDYENQSTEQFTDYVESGYCVVFTPSKKFWKSLKNQDLGKLFYFQIHYKICPSNDIK